jgi:enoyl-CoA hydratase/carnithine racemase
MTAPYKFLHVHNRDGVVFAEMSHPNYNRDEREDWPRLLESVANDDAARVLVISGWGNPPLDRPKVFENFDAYQYYSRASREPVPLMLDFPKPIVTALDGSPDVMTIPLCTDVVIAERHVVLDDHHVPLDVVSATQPLLWPLSAGLMKAKKYILTGEQLTAEEAERIGLITEVVDTGESLKRAAEIAERLASLRPEAVQATKRLLNYWLKSAMTPILEHGLALEFMLFPERYAKTTPAPGRGDPQVEPESSPR